MRRIIHNTTAIAASLALLMPQLAAAELRLPDADATAQAEQRSTQMPNLAAVLQTELSKGLTAEGLICASGDPRPCADNVRLMTPRGVMVQVTESGTIFLAPVEQQVNVADADGNMMLRDGATPAAANPVAIAAAGGAATEALAEALGQQDDKAEAAADKAAETLEKAAEKAAKTVEKAEEKAAKTLEKAEDKAEKAAEKADMAEADANSEDALAAALAAAEKTEEQPAVAQPPAEKPAVAAEADAQPQADGAADAAADALAKALADEKPAVAAEAPPAEKPAVAAEAQAETAASGNLRMADGDYAREQIAAMPGLASVLRQEVEAGLATSDLTCQTGGAAPCGDGVGLMTPRGVGVVVNDNGTVALSVAARQPNRVNDKGEVVARAPEENTVETVAAKEAAKEAAAPAAAALEAAAGAGKVVAEQTLTEADTRSSSEDFEASLRAALEQAGQQTGSTSNQQANAASGDDDSSDLTKALILGLGAVAVGQILNNNRQVALSTNDRVVVQRQDGSQEVIKDEVALLRQPGSTVTTENFDDGSSRTIVTREDGSRVVTIRDADLRVLRRTLISADGTSTMLIDDTADVQPVDVATLPDAAPVQQGSGEMSEDELRAALQRESNIDRRFTLGQIRNIPEVRALVAPVNIDAITFDTGSAAIKPDQARQLASLGQVIQEAVANNPHEIFMVEGYTDTVGADAMNLALSDRRAESVALALTEYFDVPPENMVVQGYGEQYLKVRAEGDIRENRRASVRRITDLLQIAQAN